MAQVAGKAQGGCSTGHGAYSVPLAPPQSDAAMLALCERVIANLPAGIPGLTPEAEQDARAKLQNRFVELFAGARTERDILTPAEYTVLQRALRVHRSSFWTKLYSFPCAQDEHLAELQKIVDGKTRYGNLKSIKSESGDPREDIREMLSTVNVLRREGAGSDSTTARALIAGHLVRFVLQPEKVITASNQILDRWSQLRALEAERGSVKGRGSQVEESRSAILQGLREDLGGLGVEVAPRIEEMLRSREAYLAVRDFWYQMNSKLVFVGSGGNVDAIQVGSIALLGAIERFDPSRKDVKTFASFATASIQWARKSWNRKHGMLIPCGRRHRQLHDLRDCLSMTNQRFGVDDIRGMYSVSAKDAIGLLHVASERVRVDSKIPDKRTSEVSRQAEAHADRELIERGLRGLSARQRDMVALYYGLTGESLNLQQIGDRYSVTKERARQIIADGLKKMKTQLSAELAQDAESNGSD